MTGSRRSLTVKYAMQLFPFPATHVMTAHSSSRRIRSLPRFALAAAVTVGACGGKDTVPADSTRVNTATAATPALGPGEAMLDYDQLGAGKSDRLTDTITSWDARDENVKDVREFARAVDKPK